MDFEVKTLGRYGYLIKQDYKSFGISQDTGWSTLPTWQPFLCAVQELLDVIYLTGRKSTSLDMFLRGSRLAAQYVISSAIHASNNMADVWPADVEVIVAYCCCIIQYTV